MGGWQIGAFCKEFELAQKGSVTNIKATPSSLRLGLRKQIQLLAQIKHTLRKIPSIIHFNSTEFVKDCETITNI